MEYPGHVHHPTCNPPSIKMVPVDPRAKDSPVVPVCDCGFAAWLASQDHSKNVPTTTDPNVQPYDVLPQIKAMGPMGILKIKSRS